MGERFRFTCRFLFIVMFWAMPSHSYAQLIRGFISGTVTDATTAVIAGVHVTMANVDTNISRQTLTNEFGFYRFAAVDPGNYSLEFQAPGFENHRVTGVTVSTAEEVLINQT